MFCFEESFPKEECAQSLINPSGMEDIKREMSPILTELLKLEPGNYNHPAVKQLFNWLVDPKRTGEEFSYVVGPLQGHLADLLDETDEDFNNCYDDGTYLGKVGLEALARICPVLNGAWEKSALSLIEENCDYSQKKLGKVSDHLSEWIIQVISDSKLCPSVSLRIEFMSLLGQMVDIGNHNRGLAWKAVMSVFAVLDSYYHNINLNIIKNTLKLFAKDGYLKSLDKDISKEFIEVKVLRFKIQASLNIQ